MNASADERTAKARVLMREPHILRDCYDQYAARHADPMPFEQFELAVEFVAAYPREEAPGSASADATNDHAPLRRRHE